MNPQCSFSTSKFSRRIGLGLFALIGCAVTQAQDFTEQSLAVPQVEAPAFAIPMQNGHPDFLKVGLPNPHGIIQLIDAYGSVKGGIKTHPYSHYDNWRNSGDSVSWKLSVPAPGDYEVRYTGACAQDIPENELKIECGGQVVYTTVQQTRNWNEYIQKPVGKIRFNKAGDYTLTASARRLQPNTELVRLKSVTLHPVNQRRVYDFIENSWIRDVAEIYRGSHAFMIGPRPYEPKLERKGYVIFTTKELENNLKELALFVAHKQKLGFKVQVLTEDDFGGGIGETAANNIRNWLHQNHERQGILYALMLGTAHPEEGSIPMAMMHGMPSDLPYADCSQPSGVDNSWDVLVGRIPYFNEESHDGKFADVDAILRKTIDYENEKNIHYRYSLGLDGTSWLLNSAVLESAGINYISRGVNKGSYLNPTYRGYYGNTDFLSQHVVGYQRTGGHANAHFIEGGISRDTIRARLTNRPQTVKEYGGCSCATPEFECHLAYVHLRYQAVGVLGATRSIATLGGAGKPFISKFKSDLLHWGSSTGYAHWRSVSEDAHSRGRYHRGNVQFTLLGDPSVRPFPHGLKSSYPALIRPVHHRNLVSMDLSKEVGKACDFDIENNSADTLYWSASPQVDWITLSQTSGKLDREGEVVTLKATINENVKNLSEGEYWGTIKIMANGHEQIRHILLELKTPHILPAGLDVKQQIPTELGRDIPVSSEFVSGVESSTFGASFMWKDPTQSSPIFIGKKGALLSYDAEAQKLKVKLEMNGMGGAGSWVEDQKLDQLNAEFETKFAPAPNQWCHLTLSLDRENHRVRLFGNGRLVLDEPIDRRLVHYIDFVNISKELPAAIDHLYSANFAFNQEQAVMAFRVGPEPILINPANGGVIDNKDATLKFLTGGTQVKSYQVRLAESELRLDSSTKLNAETGVVSAGDLKPLSNYVCRIDRVLNDGSVIRGKVQRFSTQKNLLLNSDLAQGHQGWQAPTGHALPKATSEKRAPEFWFIEANHACEQAVSESVEVGKLYTLEVVPTPRDKGQILARILVKHAGAEKVVAEKLLTVEDPEQNKVYYMGRQADAGKTMVVQLIRHESDMGLGEITFSMSNEAMPNQAPVIASSVTEKVYQYKVKDNIPVYDLYKGITDLDGDRFTIQKLEGPNWVDVRNQGSLFTPFGPPENAVGEHSMKLKVTDTQGNSSIFSIRIEVG